MVARVKVENDKIQRNFRNIIKLIGEDPAREGLKETPIRYSKFLEEFLESEDFNFTTFSCEDYREMVVVNDIPFYSLCEHHILPFFGKATIAYIPEDKIVGLSKIPRTLMYFCHNLQNQERITQQVGKFLEEKLEPRGVAVSLTARHMCMEMRGVKSAGASTTTTYVSGLFKDNPSTRNEFMNYISGVKHV
jgi:GTP cyclohydrolase I